MAQIGFTGSRTGLNDFQRKELKKLLGARTDLSSGHVDFHHGGCVGADAEAHKLAVLLGCRAFVHPCTIAYQRAYLTHVYKLYGEQEPLARNRDIVKITTELIACPSGKEELRSGTWATIRYARKLGRRITIVYPGDVSIEASR